MSETRKIAVIGSNSFSGSDFIDLLLEDDRNDVIGISRSPEKSDFYLPYKHHNSSRFEFYQLDLNKDSAKILDLLDTFQPAKVVNFAAQSEVGPSWDYPEQWFETNVVSLAKLTNKLRKRGYLDRYVHISSPEVYGECEGKVLESAPLNPSTPYAASKAAADLFLFTLVENYNFPMVMIRATNVYGACQQPWKIIPRSVIYIKSGKTIELHGGGAAVKSYIHIRDVSKGELAAMDKGRIGEVYHLSPPRGYAVRDVVKKICELMGREFDEATISVDERPGQDAAYLVNSNKAAEEFDWSPTVSLQDGLLEVVEWVDDHWHEIRTSPLEYSHQP